MAESVCSDPDVVETFKDILFRCLQWKWNADWNPEANKRGIGVLRQRWGDVVAGNCLFESEADRVQAIKQPLRVTRIRMAIPLRVYPPRVSIKAALTQNAHAVPSPPGGRSLGEALRNPGNPESVFDEECEDVWEAIHQGVWLYEDIYRVFEEAGASKEDLEWLLRYLRAAWNCTDFSGYPDYIGCALKIGARQGGRLELFEAGPSHEGDFLLMWAPQHAKPWCSAIIEQESAERAGDSPLGRPRDALDDMVNALRLIGPERYMQRRGYKALAADAGKNLHRPRIAAEDDGTFRRALNIVRKEHDRS